MAYDKEKAHEYYMKYRKKGLLKGRKKGKGKVSSKGKKGSKKSSKAKTPKIKKESLVGLSNSGLNEAGKMEWAAQKKAIQEQMNTELQSATDDAQKSEIRKKYQQMALDKLTEIKGDAQYGDGKKKSMPNGGLNEKGKMQWAMQKKEIQIAMNAELKNAVTDEDKASIRAKYQKSAQEIYDMMNKDATLSNPKKEKKTKKKKASKAQTKQLKSIVKKLKSQLKNMSDSDKEALKGKIETLIEKLGG